MVPAEYADAIVEAFSRSPSRIDKFSPEDFLHELGFRIYTEWCLCTSPGVHRTYDGHAFKKYVSDEIHYALERQGFIWSEGEKRFNETSSNNQNIGQAYIETRRKVLEALTESAIDFFKSCGTKDMWPSREDTRNIRRSLEPWLV